MTIGPVSYTVIAFPGNQFNGNVAPEVAKLVADGTVRILDLVFVAKDEQGDTISLEFDQMDELAAFNDIDGEVGGLVSGEPLDFNFQILRHQFAHDNRLIEQARRQHPLAKIW